MNSLKGIQYFLLGALALCLLSTKAIAASVPALISFDNPTISTEGSTEPYVIGYKFTVNTDITITALGYFDCGQDGLGYAHEVGIWNENANEWEPPLTYLTIPSGTTATLIGQYRYVDLATPLSLTAGNTYKIGAEVQGSQDNYIQRADNIVTDPRISFLQSVIRFDPAPSSPPNTPVADNFDRQYLQSNFLMQPVPVPGAAWLFGSGLVCLVGLRRRLMK